MNTLRHLCFGAALAGIGILRAQTPTYTYEVVSIKPSEPGQNSSRIGPGAQGGMRMQNVTVMQVLTFAHDARSYQFVGAPGWAQTERFDIDFTPDKPETAPTPGMPREQMDSMFNRQRQRVKAILRDRFAMVLHPETREMPIYALTVAKGGHKLATPKEGVRGPNMRTGNGEISADGAYLAMLTNSLSSLLGRYVSNETGLDGPFDFKVQWTPDSGPPPSRPEEGASAREPGSSIFTAITEQLGLKLEAKKGPVPVYVVEKIEKPSAN